MAPPTVFGGRAYTAIKLTVYDTYPFHVYSTDDMALLKDLETYFPDSHQEVVQEYNQLAAHILGECEYAEIPFHVTRSPDLSNGPKGHLHYVYSFRSRQDYETLMKRLEVLEESKSEEADKEHAIYRFAETKYQRRETFKPLSIDFLIGRDEIYHNIIEQMHAHTHQAKFLQSVGENGRSINLLFYGPPGTGKSSMVLIIATALQLPIYVVNPTSLRPELVQAALSPQGGGKGMKLLLYDDIDRYIATQGTVLMSQILNSLDGLDDDGKVIRIFSANDERILQQIPALMSRFTATYKFDIPDQCMFAEKVGKLMQFYGSDWRQRLNKNGEMEELCARAKEHGLSFRVFTNYLIRFLFPPSSSTEEQKRDYNPLHACLEMDAWSAMIVLQAQTRTNAASTTIDDDKSMEGESERSSDDKEDLDYEVEI